MKTLSRRRKPKAEDAGDEATETAAE